MVTFSCLGLSFPNRRGEGWTASLANPTLGGVRFRSVLAGTPLGGSICTVKRQLCTASPQPPKKKGVWACQTARQDPAPALQGTGVLQEIAGGGPGLPAGGHSHPEPALGLTEGGPLTPARTLPTGGSPAAFRRQPAIFGEDRTCLLFLFLKYGQRHLRHLQDGVWSPSPAGLTKTPGSLLPQEVAQWWHSATPAKGELSQTQCC